MSEPHSALDKVLVVLQETWNQAPPALRRFWPWLIAGGVVAGFLLVWLLRSGGSEHEGTAQRGAAGASGAGGGAPESAAAALQPPLAPEANADAGAPLSPNVKLTFRTYPPRRAVVTWGAKRLGFIDKGKPLVVERVRDSGPLDVIVRSQGFLPVHARAYTFNDSNVDVKITPIDKQDTLYGYQQPLTDAGVP
jgi:hypothetical protein